MLFWGLAALIFLYLIAWLVLPIYVTRRTGDKEAAGVIAMLMIPIFGWVLFICGLYDALLDEAAEKGKAEIERTIEPEKNTLLRAVEHKIEQAKEDEKWHSDLHGGYGG